MIRSRLGFALLLGASGLLACADGSPTAPTEPKPDVTPVLRFAYSGDRAGTYEARGNVALDGDGRPVHGTWAAALMVPGSDLSIAAARAGTSPMADVVLIALHRIDAPGTYSLDSKCNHETPTSCAIGMLAFDYRWDSAEPPPNPLFMLVNGTVTIGRIDDAGVRGTFSVTGLSQSAQSAIALTSGSFDVPVTRANPIRARILPLWNALAAFRAAPD